MRSLKYCLAMFGMMGILTIGLVGCGDGAATKDKEKKAVGQANTPADDHHGHEHGPMGGELAKIPGTDMTLEVVAKYGQDLVAISIYESDKKTSTKIKCEQLIGRIAAAADKEFVIEGVDTEDGMTSKFEIEDQDFAIARKTTGCKLEFELDGKKVTVEIPKDPHG